MNETEHYQEDYDEQLAKYIMVTFYKEQLGKVQLREFLIRYPITMDENDEIKPILISNFGLRQIFFSKQMLHNP